MLFQLIPAVAAVLFHLHGAPVTEIYGVHSIWPTMVVSIPWHIWPCGFDIGGSPSPIFMGKIGKWWESHPGDFGNLRKTSVFRETNFFEKVIWRFSWNRGLPKLTMAFNTKLVIHGWNTGYPHRKPPVTWVNSTCRRRRRCRGACVGKEVKLLQLRQDSILEDFLDHRLRGQLVKIWPNTYNLWTIYIYIYIYICVYECVCV